MSVPVLSPARPRYAAAPGPLPRTGGEAASIDDADIQLSKEDFALIAGIARDQAGIVIRAHKAAMIRGRLLRRLRALNLRSVRDYCDLLRGPDADAELPQLLNVLTTNHTAFFRERHHFDHMRAHGLPETLAHAARGDGRVRIWCAAASTGEEPYSIAAIVNAVNPGRNLDVRILATDIDTDVLARATAAEYSREVVERAPADLRGLLQCEPAGRDTVRIGANLRRLLTFRQLNLVQPWPMRGPFDAILCRNVMIYFDGPTKKSIVDRSFDLLRPGGWLYLGHSESLSPPHPGFELIGRTVYRRR
ncbi:protein-glutamate O-methyltransferase CheR [Alsobacter sp. SYSU M60028]|uniref:Chemotaxis protein methyltransferase n=1 Tax=Alsobacter ponti TaxID=2962936 RepID=A0ABT1L8K1_9HYPH|nr:protein-glutamate O-methyltransferase CheR [Alsobacter ponti]MCP8937825.1 protein-glutamate O-methyltransferase CheR [Alsobacter ponti]